MTSQDLVQHFKSQYPHLDFNLPLSVQLDSLSQVMFFVQVEKALGLQIDPLLFERESCSLGDAIERVARAKK